MAVQYTMLDIIELDEAMQKFAPPFPVARDAEKAERVSAVSTLGLPIGLLLNARLDNGDITLLYLNPVVALDLLTKIMHVGKQGHWWDENVELIPSDAGA